MSYVSVPINFTVAKGTTVQSSEIYLNSLLVLLPDEVGVVLTLLGLFDVVEVVDPQVHRQGDRLQH